MSGRPRWSVAERARSNAREFRGARGRRGRSGFGLALSIDTCSEVEHWRNADTRAQMAEQTAVARGSVSVARRYSASGDVGEGRGHGHLAVFCSSGSDVFRTSDVDATSCALRGGYRYQAWHSTSPVRAAGVSHCGYVGPMSSSTSSVDLFEQEGSLELSAACARPGICWRGPCNFCWRRPGFSVYRRTEGVLIWREANATTRVHSDTIQLQRAHHLRDQGPQRVAMANYMWVFGTLLQCFDYSAADICFVSLLEGGRE